MIQKIITDTTLLRQKSSEIIDDYNQIMSDLVLSEPENSLGLAAPQIGEFKRIFLANLTIGKFIFVNPKIERFSPDKYSSVESCLSLPGITRCIERHFQVWISASVLLKIHMDKNLSTTITEEVSATPSNPIRLKSIDSFIAQHEIDHLNGILIIDLPEIEEYQQKLNKKHQKTRQSIRDRRDREKSEEIRLENTKRRQQSEKISRKQKDKELKILEIKERYLMSQQVLLKKSSDPN